MSERPVNTDPTVLENVHPFSRSGDTEREYATGFDVGGLSLTVLTVFRATDLKIVSLTAIPARQEQCTHRVAKLLKAQQEL